MIRIPLLLLFFIVSSDLLSQIGGSSSYRFLTIPGASRSASLGGYVLTNNDSDMSVVGDNPATINKSLHNAVSLSYINYISDVNLASVNYGYDFKKIGTFVFNLNYLDYGKFILSDIYGEKQGNFYANDASLNISYGKKLHSYFSIGASIKALYSSYYLYNSYGIAADIAGSYTGKKKAFSTTVVVRNFGYIIDSYTNGIKDKLPFTIQVGVSQRIAHAPFRLYGQFNNLQKWNLTYHAVNDTNITIDPLSGEVVEKQFTFDRLMRHTVVGVDFIPSSSFIVSLAYNYQRRKELGVAAKGGLAGISFGLSIKLPKFNLGYSLASYHLKGYSNTITLTTNLSHFLGRKHNAENNDSKTN